MAKKTLIGALAMLMASAIALPSVAFAAPLGQSNQARGVDTFSGGVNIEPAATYWKKKKPGYARYDRRWHGDRYRHRYGNYRHYHNGYYYASPWWLLAAPLVAGAYAAPRIYDDNEGYGGEGYGGNAHVEWCLDRYRSYDPRSNTFMGYDGYRHACNSPY